MVQDKRRRAPSQGRLDLQRKQLDRDDKAAMGRLGTLFEGRNRQRAAVRKEADRKARNATQLKTKHR